MNYDSFVSYYDYQGIMPVKQDLDDFSFARKRHHLYRLLGLPVSLLKDLKILEFGPGGGFNATALTQGSSSQAYWCVEGSSVGYELVNQHFHKQLIKTRDFKAFKQDFLSFSTTEKFDLVIAEACIPGQKNPSATLKHISKFVKDEGFLIITCTSKSSQLSEILRSAYALSLREHFKNEVDFQIELCNIFSQHLSNLGVKTRSVQDWVDDNINQRWHSRKADFSPVEALDVLTEFEFIHSSPALVFDLSWYKSYLSGAETREEKVRGTFPVINLTLLDLRIFPEQISSFTKHEVSITNSMISEVYDTAREILVADSSGPLFKILADKIEHLASLNTIQQLPTFGALAELANFFNGAVKSPRELSHFAKWWGRGQQYLSLFRKPNTV